MWSSTQSRSGLQARAVDVTSAVCAWLIRNGGHGMSHHHLQMSRARTRQKRKALHMLVLSGVLRPSRIELRYALPLLNHEDQSSACHDESKTAAHSSRLLEKSSSW